MGLATANVAFSVERDTALQIAVPQLNVAALGDDECLVASAAAPERVFALSRTELSGAQWKHLLAGLSPDQAAEFAGVQFESGDRPLRNLSLRHARTLAALAGGHLPTLQEIVLAARAHAPASALPYPWGATFVGDKVSADPANSTQTDAVDARPEGESLFGALNLVGNVAEVLSVGSDGVARTHGGDHLSNAEQVRIGATEVLAEFDAPGPRVGVRVARFVSPTRDDDVSAATAVGTRFESLWREGGVVVLNDWEIDEFGAARNRLRVAGVLLNQKQELTIPWSTPGFLQDSKASIRLGNSDVPANRLLTRDGEFSSLIVPTASIAAGSVVSRRCVHRTHAALGVAWPG